MLKIKKTKIKKTKIKKTKIKKTKIKKTKRNKKNKIKKTKRNKKNKIKKTKRNKKAKGVPSLQELSSRSLARHDNIIDVLTKANYPEDIIHKVRDARINAANIIAQKFRSIPKTNLSYMKKLIKDKKKDINPVQRTELDKYIKDIKKIINKNRNDWWNKKVTEDSIKKLEIKLEVFLNPTEEDYEYDDDYGYTVNY